MTLKEMMEAIWNSISGCQCPNHRTGWEAYKQNDMYEYLIPKQGKKYK